jgi:predicted outer membrane protein
MKFKTFFAGSLATILAANVVVAQQAAQQPQAPSQARQLQPATQIQSATQAQSGNQARQGAASLTKDQVLASCLIIGNKEEVAIAKFAKENTKNSQVKEFAAMLQEEHQAGIDKLAKLAPQSAQGSFSDSSTKASTAPKTDHMRDPQNFDVVALQQELAQQCLNDSKETLSEKEGGKFDQCFVGMQLAKHAAMKTQLTVFQRHATGELKDIIAQGLETTKKHMKTAENLMEQLAESDAGDSSRSRKSE